MLSFLAALFPVRYVVLGLSGLDFMLSLFTLVGFGVGVTRCPRLNTRPVYTRFGTPSFSAVTRIRYPTRHGRPAVRLAGLTAE